MYVYVCIYIKHTYVHLCIYIYIYISLMELPASRAASRGSLNQSLQGAAGKTRFSTDRTCMLERVSD